MAEKTIYFPQEPGETGYRVSEFGDHFRERALIGVHYFEIERLVDKKTVVKTDDGDYKIIPFLFEAEDLRENMGGCHWIIPGGVSTKVQLITEPNYQLSTRAVEGSGWFLRWHPQRGINITWVDTRLGLRNPVVTSGYQWLVCWVASPDTEQLIVEGVDRPHYDPKFERELRPGKDRDVMLTTKDGQGEKRAIFGLSDFWYHLHRLRGQEHLLRVPGR